MILRVLDLFSGIGGFSLGLEKTGGFKTVAFCEIDPFCQKVLAKHWPGIPIFDDIKTLNKDKVDKIGRIDAICGGFPCQPVSCAGKRKGAQDERWLWPEFYRVVCEVRPGWVIIENVPGLLSADSGRLFAGILRDLSSSGYDAEWNIVSAAFVGAPHLRKRVFIVAHPNKFDGHYGRSGTSEVCRKREQATIISGSEDDVAHPISLGRHGRAGMFGQGWRGESEDGCSEVPDTQIPGLQESEGISGAREGFAGSECGCLPEREPTADRTVECRLGIFTDGLSEGLADAWRPGWEYGTPRLAICQKDRVNRLKALGNAIVPQCSEYVGRCLQAFIIAANEATSRGPKR